MSLEALAERTWKTQRVLLLPLVALGTVLLIAGLISGLPIVTGFGVTFAFAGGFGLWRLRVKAAEFKALLANPQRVTNVIPIVQTVQGMGITHYPVVLVADDGKTYRIATWTQSVDAAIAPFIEKFPHARGADGDSVFSPDDGFGARFKLIGVMLGSLLAGLVIAGLIALPTTLAHLAQTNVAYENQVKRNRTEGDALAALSKGPELGQPWADCSADSLEPSIVPGLPPAVGTISVWLDGAQAKTWSSKRDGYLSSKYALKLDTATERQVYRSDFLDTWLNALMGQKLHFRPPEREWAIVGVRSGDTLRLRLLDLDDGKVQCEGTARIAQTTPDSAYEENTALANAVMRPFCGKLPEGTCPAEEPVVAPEPAPLPTTKAKATPKGKPASSRERDAISRVVRSASPRVSACYESALRKRPSLAGTLTMSLLIGGKGNVATASGTGFPDATVTTCVSKIFMALRFPAPADGKPLTVEYPLTFQPSK